ncbi:cytochrome c oxidase assembly factor CtaG [Sinomonas atrocyanea]|uniref:cytochrome c oxidase assembly protein n=1 Tax=Sinomonas atrocyanea TaxID=37927 RepID=UPI00277FE37E|nr:cytochrome c oxidase assembly protein [Sinomonas atrocyanea]MDP9885441.1 cytochrome c oxidase assembly factor CtaG [Sinomonas atrocyanea]
MPPLTTVLASFALDPAAALLAIAAAALYGVGMARARRRGTAWPLWRALCFYVLGLVPYLVLACGFTGAYGSSLRWAFTLKIALMFFVVPLFAGLGRPVGLAQAALGNVGRARLGRVMQSRAVRILGNAFVAPIIGLLLFGTFLTPLLALYRSQPVASGALSILVPLVGLILALPLTEAESFERSSAFLVLEFVYVFIELLADAIPGIFLRLAPTVLDGVSAWPAGAPSWFPSPLRDQQLAGDLLWFIAEAVDIPVIILMFVRFSRSDRREARSFDELTDEEMDALAEEHLRRRNG